jgi:hypothetical protein
MLNAGLKFGVPLPIADRLGRNASLLGNLLVRK